MKAFIRFFSVLAFFLMLFNSGSLFAAEEAASMMCDEGVVNIGDMDTDVQDACGYPASQGMNEWVYNFGPSQPVYTLTFKEGKVVRIMESE